ncbi:hypothetical protein [Flavobacterium rhizosphaerae]|uniref:Lipoprotein n=1 Tax=Flavobacterium rhizosphaerae TaxID=3163298 RepID=A0ABW8YZJ8_9FLAO
MKRIALFIICQFLFLGCQHKEHNPVNESVQPENAVAAKSNDAGHCIEKFKELRDVLYSGNKEEFKQYFSFPVLNSEVWSLIAKSKGNYEGKKYNDPFTEADYDNHFDLIFTPHFINALLKIKPKELFEKGKFITPHIIESGADVRTEYFMQAEYYEEDELILALNYEFYSEDEKTESAIVYFFTLKDCKPIFNKVMIAG